MSVLAQESILPPAILLVQSTSDAAERFVITPIPNPTTLQQQQYYNNLLRVA